MERRGIATEKGNLNRQIAADNKLLREIKARITRLYNWSKAEAEKPVKKGTMAAVSYTHLDVYKRQALIRFMRPAHSGQY